MTLATPVSSRPAVYPESPRRVLLVDSTKELRLHLGGLLRPAGYELMAVDSVLAARVALARARPLLVLVDWRALSLEGGPGCALLHNRASLLEVPLMLVAGPGTPAELLEQGMRSGVEDCVLAPVRGAELLARLSALREADRRGASRPAEHRAPRTVLVVGEEPGLKGGLGGLLEACGHHLVYAATRERALALARGHGGPFHLLLVRTTLTSSEEMLRVEHLRTQAHLERVPTVVVTSGVAAEVQAFGQLWLSERTLVPRQLLARVNSLLQRNATALLVEERVPFVCPVEYREAGCLAWSSCLSSELSPGALFLRTLVPARPRAALELRLHLPTTGEVLEGTGLVAWANPFAPRRTTSYPLGMGVIFLGMSPRRLMQLRELCRSETP
jgi:DNA-binding response OmpR family regulator